MNLPQISIRRPVLATVMTVSLVLMGIVGLLKMNIDEYPNMSFPYVTVQINYDGAQCEQVDGQVVRKVEEAVGEAKGVRHITSVSKEGSAEVGVEFNMEINAAEATQEVRDKVLGIRGELPTGISEPVIARYDMNAAPVAAIAVTSEKLTMRELSILVDEKIKNNLQKIPGVGQLSIYGNEDREIQLLLNTEALRAFALSPSELALKIGKEIKEVPGGKLDDGQNKLSVITKNRIFVPQDLAKMVVATRGGHPVYFHQIGSVSDTIKDKTSIARYDNKPAIGIEIGKQSGGNAVEVAKAVKKELEIIQSTLPEGVNVYLIRDDAKRISDVINDVYLDLVIGSLFAVLVVFMFLGDIRSTIISAVTIPTSLISSFFFMYLSGFSVNTMSMLGLSLAIGLLIDDAIVVIENIIRHRDKGEDIAAASDRGTAEIVLAVIATSLSVVAVFLPIGFINGVSGEMFKEFGITIVYAVIVSLFISFTLTPMLASRFLKNDSLKQNCIMRIQQRFSHQFDILSERYAMWLRHILMNHKKYVLTSASVLFILSFALLPLIGMEMMPSTDKGQFTVKYQLTDGDSLKRKTEISEEITMLLMDMPEIEHIYATNSTRDEQSFFVKLKDKSERPLTMNQTISKVRAELNAIPGIRISIEGLTDMGSKSVEISLCGDNLARLGEASETIIRTLERIPQVVDISTNYRPGNPRLSIQTKDNRAHDLGVSSETIGNTVGILLEGIKTGKFNDTDELVDVRLRLLESGREKPSQLDYIQVETSKTDANDNAILVPLSSVAQWKYDTTPAAVHRYNRQKEIRVSANLDGMSLGEFEKVFDQEMQNVELPYGVSLGSAGEANEMDDTLNSILMTLFLGIAFIFLILSAQFESFTEPFAIMAALPLAFIGALLGLFICGSNFSMISGIGILLLMGLVTKNAILLIDFAKKRIENGDDCITALVEAGKNRFRPIMMTTIAMMFAMIPVAIGFGDGGEARAPMAHAILGGLITSTLLTLVVIPCLYVIVKRHKISVRTENRIYSGEKYGI